MMIRVRVALAGIAAAVCSAPLAGQGSCTVETLKPFQLQSAAVYLQRHDANPKDPEERAKNLRQAVRALTDNPGRIKNEAGRNMLLVAAYVRWYADQGATPSLKAKRSDVGIAENPDGEFLLPNALDEALSAIEREVPACADSTGRYRMAFIARLENAAITAYNAKSYDAALESANYALVLRPRGAQAVTAYQVLANAAHAKGDVPLAITYYGKYFDALGQDAAAAGQRADVAFNAAVLTRDHAASLEGDARTAAMRQAVAWFNRTVEQAPEGPRASTARLAAAKLEQELLGGAQAGEDIYAAMLADPSKYTALQLFEAGVAFANKSQFTDAAKAYEAGLQMNPGYRDALFNVASVYRALHRPDQMAAVVDKLRAIDPVNPDVLKLAGAVWEERLASATDARAKRTAQDSVAAYVDRAAKAPARVRVTRFAVARGSVTLEGAVDNLTSTPATYTLIFEFVDRAGNGVGSTTVLVEKVPAKSTAQFSAQASGASPVAWRYMMR